MKTLVKTFVWLVLLVLAIGGIVREYVLRAWVQRDDVLKQQVVDKLRELFPDARVQVDDVKYDFGRDVVITGFELKPNGQSVPIVQLPQTVVHIDRDALIERQQLDVRKVVIRSPKLELVRDRAGNWNWQSLLPLPEQEKGSLPEIAIEDGTVTVRVEQTLGIPSGALTLEHVDIRLAPSGKRQFRIEARSRCEHTGKIELSGCWHLDQQTGQIDGQFTEITAGQELLGLAASFAPDIRAKLEDWEAKLAELLSRPADPQSGLPFSVSLPATVNHPNASGRIGSVDSILGLRATANVGFCVSRPEAGQTPVFHVWMGVKDGEVTNPILPFPLQNLRGELYVDNESFKVVKLTAHNGTTKVLIDGALKGRDTGYPGKFEVKISNMLCDARLRSRLSIGFGRIYDAHRPTGDLDLHCFVVHDQEGRWRPEGLIVTAKDCSLAHDSFPYPIENANGTIEQQGRDLIIDMQGTASGRPITLKGTVSQPGPNSTMVLNVECNDLPLDDVFLQACKPELQAAIRKMRLTGVMDGKVRLTKAPREPIVPRITAVLRDGSMVYEAFPYHVDNLTGRLSATGGYWEFHELTGRHGTAVLTADGSYAKLKNVGELKMKVVTQQAPLDESLFRAVPASLKRVWREFSPTGVVDVVTDIHWLTDRPADIRMPRVALSNGSLTLKTLPYRLDDVQASFAYGLDKDGLQKLSVQSLEGRHGEMTTAVSGYQKIETNGDWRARFEKFTIENLTPNDEFLKSLAALPGLRQVFGNFDPNQTLRMDGVMELRGTPDPNDPITAAWDLDTFFSNGTIHTGLDFKDLHGRVRANGTWDGEQASIRGLVDLKSARILDYVLNDLRGPFRVKDGVLMFGAGDTQRTRPPESLKPSERLTAKLFDGVVLLDGAATLMEQPEYQVLINLQNARLERFAALHAPKQRNLRGITNGWINLRGKGSSPQDVTGSGQIQISPAALLNLPVVLQMYRSLSLAEPEESTFSYAQFDFNIKDARFNFDRLFLEGDSISFRGRGSVGFDSSVNLNFYSMLPRNQIPIPIVHEILGEATKGWVGIKVRGKLSQPETKIEAVPLLEPALKNFLGVLPQPLLPIGQGLRPRGPIRN